MHLLDPRIRTADEIPPILCWDIFYSFTYHLMCYFGTHHYNCQGSSSNPNDFLLIILGTMPYISELQDRN